MSDLISRQAAIDALDGEIEITGRTNAEAVKGYVRLVKDRLERLPSAQPERTCVNCGRTANNGGWYADGGNKMPDRRTLCTAERWVLPFVGEKERYG